MEEIFNAKKARELADRVDTTELNTVLEYIENTAEDHNYYCYYYEIVNDNVKTKLKELGFTLYENNDQREGYFLRIEW